MFEFFETIILSPVLILMILIGTFLGITRWALLVRKEYAGYALGLLLGFFFVVVYSALGGGSAALDATNTNRLNAGQVVFPTFLGLAFGAVILLGALLAQRLPRTLALQIAFYTAFNLVLLLMMFILGPIGQRMIGIFALAFGITTLFAVVLFGGSQAQSARSASAQGAPGDPNEGRTRLDNIRQDFQRRDDVRR